MITRETKAASTPLLLLFPTANQIIIKSPNKMKPSDTRISILPLEQHIIPFLTNADVFNEEFGLLVCLAAHRSILLFEFVVSYNLQSVSLIPVKRAHIETVVKRI